MIKMPLLIRLSSLVFLFSLSWSCSNKEQSSNIPDVLFNDAWLFHKGEAEGAEAVAFNADNWRQLDLPHDWAIEGPFDSKYNARTGGLPVHGTGWYRKHFVVPEEMSGKQVTVLFDGAMNNAEVWLNGKLIGARPYGYIGFEVDLTSHVKFGEENVIAVKLTPEDLSARWYPGAGIYRNVHLKYNSSIHIPNWGVYITTPEVTNERSMVNIQTKVANKGNAIADIILKTRILDKDGQEVASTSTDLSISAQQSAL